MSWASPSLLITDRLCLHPVTRLSSYGTHLVFANTLFRYGDWVCSLIWIFFFVENSNWKPFGMDTWAIFNKGIWNAIPNMFSNWNSVHWSVPIFIVYMFAELSLHSVLICPQEDTHKDWVSCVRFSPNAQNPIIVSCGWDRVVKVVLLQLYIISFVFDSFDF